MLGSHRYGLVVAGLCTGALSQFLYVSSYNGTVTTLDMSGVSECPNGMAGKEAVEMKILGNSTACGTNPSYLVPDQQEKLVYCIDEAWQTGRGALTAMKTCSGEKRILDGGVRNEVPINGPVFGGLFDNGKKMAVSNFGNESVSVWDVSSPQNLQLGSSVNFILDEPGASDKQLVSKPHQTLVDPSGNFVVVSDFGADMIRVFSVRNGDFIPAGEYKVTKGSGPRHAAFTTVKKEGDVERAKMVLVNELRPEIDVYDVVYKSGNMTLEKLNSTTPIHGEGTRAPKDAFPSEVVISSDDRFVIISSRNENNLRSPTFINNGTQPSDPIINFKFDVSTGKLSDPQEIAAGGRFPRHFSMNEAGTLLAVALQKDGLVVLIPRDPATGKLGPKPVAFARLAEGVSSVIFSGKVECQAEQ
ncbi:hypothetical protein CDD80_2664 [Ophiocordyceps camponoti-rufipedis]|uniref:6-phosphogluconolactonase n=1 Tax=Ophiocordyceps camponoti-rufipedis TaxID=2004952 RepID=A0A2C5Z204_9HYPO|nr:hypothetical protein CDD80_2664 [Ophiocordyceps camponoti-rufipedis]